MRASLLVALLAPCAALADGAHLDPAFGTGGVAEVFWPDGAAVANAVGIDATGRILIGGRATGPWGDDDFALLRLLSDGSFDATYASDAGGVRLVDFGLDGIGSNGDDAINDLAVLDDGSAIALGEAHFGFGAVNSQFALVRTDADGVLDPGFGEGGLAHFGFEQFGNIDIGYRLALDAEGRIVTTGRVVVDFAVNEPLTWFFGLARLTPDGHFDPSFVGGGFFVAPFWADSSIPPPRHSEFNIPAALAFDDSARIVLGGTVSDPIPQDAVAYRVQPDGAFDDTFGQAGHSLLGIDVGEVTALHALDDGTLIAAGAGGASSDAAVLFFARLDADGSLDATFGDAGIARLSTPESFAEPVLIEPTADGGWLAVGRRVEWGGAPAGIVLARVDADGQPDTGFGNNGVVTLDLTDGRHFDADRVALQSDGKFVVAGSIAIPDPVRTPHFAVIRIVIDPEDALFADGFDGG